MILLKIDFINYGLYLPPDCSKKGKFLQDERIISEYPQLVTTKFDSDEKTNATTDHVMHSDQLIHQINKHDHNNDNNNNKNNEIIDGNKIKEPVLLELLPKIRFVEEYRSEGSKTTTRRIHSKHHQKRLLSAIKRDDINRVNDLLNQGLDPNFQYPSKGITPLGCTTELNDPREMILQLVNAGAHLDYRDSDTMTALHRAAICGNLKAIEVFLELGQNPNVRDKHNLTPLYYACSEDIKPECIQRLLFDHAILGVTDDKGRQEIHQACLNGRVKTLRQLIIYGADLNAQVENHNTPLHLCVLADEMECMQMLLSCGASPTIMNSSGQTPYELAILIERMNLAKILQNFDEKSVDLLKFSRRINLLRQRFPNCRIRSIALERGVSGYGFIMQGSNSLKERITTRNNLPSQRIMSVQPNSKAEKSGLVPGDYLLEINGIDVYDATHTEVVDLITATRDMLNLKIINFQQIPEIRSNDSIQQHKSSEIRTQTMNTTQAFTSPLSSTSSSPYINTYTGTSTMSSKDNRLERALSESTNVMVTKESKTPETCQSTITLHNRLFEKQGIHKLETQSLSSTPTKSTSITTTTTTSSSQSPSSYALTRLNSTSSIKCKQQHYDSKDNDYMKSLQYFEQSIQNTHRPPVIDYNHQHSHYDNIKCKEEFIDTWDTSWDSESDLVNISEITEISVNSINEKSLNCVKQAESTNHMSTLYSSLSPNKHKLMNEMKVDMNNQMKSTHCESYLHRTIVDRNSEKTIDTNNSNHSYNGLNHSNEYRISVDNLKMNGHDVDNDEPDSCLI
ncbi:SH3 and multiple ankyrin repeat domains protein 3 [Schistosoma japonicum]|nr:SH3 and multiple ankyrin repeat domains protein 3 [Schistosoma japonicum]